MPKYCCTWDAEVILKYMTSFQSVEDMTSKELALRLGMLLALLFIR